MLTINTLNTQLTSNSNGAKKHIFLTLHKLHTISFSKFYPNDIRCENGQVTLEVLARVVRKKVWYMTTGSVRIVQPFFSIYVTERFDRKGAIGAWFEMSNTCVKLGDLVDWG